MARLDYKKSGLVIGLDAVFVLGIPSLPARRYPLIFRAVALLLETGVIYALSSLDTD